MNAVRDYAEANGVGLIEAKRTVLKANKIERLEKLRSRSIHSAHTSSVLCDLINELIEEAKAA
jgi:hypothetical protein